jgi:prepilin-type N-terminal cleavage/methylation domain-containing protein
VPLTRRRGVTLTELVVSLALLGLAGSVITRTLLQQRRSARSALDLADARRTVHETTAWLSAELRPLGRGDSSADLIRLAPESLSYRAFRSGALACSVSASEVQLLARSFTGWRLPQAGRDSLLLWVAPDGPGPLRPSWAALPILGVGPSTCPGGPSIRLATAIDTSRVQLPRLSPLTPARTYEVMQVRLYSSLGRWWIGARSESGGEVIQPLAGPVSSAGFRLSARDSLGASTADPALARELELRLETAPVAESAGIRLGPWNLRP